MALTHHEESVLKRLAHDHTPMQRPAVQHAAQPVVSAGDWLANTLTKLPKMTTVDPNEDWVAINRVSHTMHKGEKLLEWYARTTIGRAQLMSMSRDEITRAVARAEERNAEDGFKVRRCPARTEERPTPLRFAITQ